MAETSSTPPAANAQSASASLFASSSQDLNPLPLEIVATPSPAPSPSNSQDYWAPRSPTPPPSFNFTQPAPSAPEASYFSAISIPEIQRTQRNIRELGILINSRRRTAAQNTLRGAATAYIDQDDSGTYDPKRRRATPPEPTFRKSKRQRVEEFDGDGNPRPKKQSRLVGYRNLITFKFTTDQGLAYLRSITSDPFSECHKTDEEESDTGDDSGYSGSFPRPKRTRKKKPVRVVTSKRDDGLTLGDLTIGHPQRRGCKSCFLSGDDECTLIEDSHAYPCEACDDAGLGCEFIIPPEYKKICKRCKSKKIFCSYKLDGGKDQDKCEACADTDVPCCAAPRAEGFTRRNDDVISPTTPEREVLAAQKEHSPPERDRLYVACNQCRYNDKRCSLKGKRSMEPCSNCRKAGQQCEFILEPRRKRSSYSSAPAVQKTMPKGKKSQRRRDETPPPRRRRKLSADPLTPNANTQKLYSELEAKILKKHKRLGVQGKQHHSKKHEKENGQQSSRLIGSTLGIQHTFITTAFCHPIKFNYIPPPTFSPFTLPSVRHRQSSSISTSFNSLTSSNANTSKPTKKPDTISPPPPEPCNFCDDPFFGITGHADTDGPRRVEGFYSPTGSGFEEISGGFSELNIKPDKMCVPCTTSRIRIISCGGHRIRKLRIGVKGGFMDGRKTEVDEKVFDDKEWGVAQAGIFAGDIEKAKLIMEAKWCSICPNLAQYTCVAKQLAVEGEAEEGCGLLLCDACVELMGKLWMGGIRTNPLILSKLMREIISQSYRFPQGVRADATFLTPEGELMMRLEQGMGEGPLNPTYSNAFSFKFEADSNKPTNPKSKPKKEIKGKGRDWSYFSPRFRPQGWDEDQDHSPSSSPKHHQTYENDEDEKTYEVQEPSLVATVKKPNPEKAKQKQRFNSEIAFGGVLNRGERREQDMRVERAFGGQSVIDLTGEEDD